jgi:hypothetical protein
MRTAFRLIGQRWTIRKDPDAILDYGIRLADWLPPGDSLPGDPKPEWEISDGLAFVLDDLGDPTVAYQGGIAYVLLAGGVRGRREWARCTWNTKGRRREQRTLFFIIDDN